ncbi:MAG: hypothetical protein Q7R56_02270 [Nanoarchaeota archaeon]|nr:hypothetical protein [Nanoarchaeota archaeon]
MLPHPTPLEIPQRTYTDKYAQETYQEAQRLREEVSSLQQLYEKADLPQRGILQPIIQIKLEQSFEYERAANTLEGLAQIGFWRRIFKLHETYDQWSNHIYNKFLSATGQKEKLKQQPTQTNSNQTTSR